MVFQGRPAPLLHTQLSQRSAKTCNFSSLLPWRTSPFFSTRPPQTRGALSPPALPRTAPVLPLCGLLSTSLCRKHLDPLAQHQSHNPLTLDFAVSLQSVKVQVCVWGGGQHLRTELDPKERGWTGPETALSHPGEPSSMPDHHREKCHVPATVDHDRNLVPTQTTGKPVHEEF